MLRAAQPARAASPVECSTSYCVQAGRFGVDTAIGRCRAATVLHTAEPVRAVPSLALRELCLEPEACDLLTKRCHKAAHSKSRCLPVCHQFMPPRPRFDLARHIEHLWR